MSYGQLLKYERTINSLEILSKVRNYICHLTQPHNIREKLRNIREGSQRLSASKQRFTASSQRF